MQTLSNRSGSDCNGKTSWENRDIGDDLKTIIKSANTVDILSIFKKYNLEIDEYNKKICCPFPHHNDNSPSFYFYKETNSFNCFGCKVGGRAVQFVSLMEKIEPIEAAKKILQDFIANTDLIEEKNNIYEQRKLILSFSKITREFIQSNLNDNEAVKFIDKICLMFDTLVAKHSFDNNKLKELIEKLNIKVTQWQKQ